MTSKILVAGVGNIFLGDDAFGIEVVQRLAQLELGEGVTVRDFGIRSFDLAYALMEKWELVILVDALPRGGTPGTVYVFEPDLPQAGEVPEMLDGHSMNPVAVLRLVHALGGQPGRLLLVGCEPAAIDHDADGVFGLSREAQCAVEAAVRVIEDLITRTAERLAA